MSQRPQPRITDDNRPHWEGAREGRLVLPYCEACARFFYPISPFCPFCLKAPVAWKPVSGRGRVSSWVVFHKAFYPYFADRLPYVVVQVELEEGPRVNGNLFGLDPGSIRLGLPVEATFEREGAEVTLPQFRARAAP
ncbi:MAG: OB-fold domain-containing protein [Proteobacteria bacterium]|nr:OB-fold domain-containing protein [Pseudomonadota bacterium]